jgi:hypothetical protein
LPAHCASPPARYVYRIPLNVECLDNSFSTLCYPRSSKAFPKFCPSTVIRQEYLWLTVGLLQEASEGRIDLPEDDPEAVKLLIEYLYTAEYGSKLHNLPEDLVYTYDFPHTCVDGCNSEIDGKKCWELCPHHKCGSLPEIFTNCNDDCKDFVCSICIPDAPQLLLHAKLYEIGKTGDIVSKYLTNAQVTVGDKYNVIGLKDLAREKFAGACKLFWDNVQFVVAARHACSTTPEHDVGLRHIVRDTIVDHPGLVVKVGVDELLGETPGLARDVLKKVIRK